MQRERRRERRELRAYARSGEDRVGGELVDVEGRLDARADSPRLAAALAGLAAKDREVLLLFAWADLSYGEISQALEIPVGTVRSRLARARRHLHGALDDERSAPDRPATEGAGN